ncbi:MAG: heme-binding protein [Paludibaculum sp.]
MIRPWGPAKSLALCLAFSLSSLAIGASFDDTPGNSNNNSECSKLPSYSELKAALATATATETSGLNNQMWATVVNRDGVVCAVAFSGENRGAQWPGSRVISAQKANAANAFSLDPSSDDKGSGQANGLALSTANLYSAVQPGGSLFGLQHSNPVDTSVAYKGPASKNGTSNDPMVGSTIGGVNVFGGGLALYATGHKLVGGVGVSGDTSCADHNIAWRVRNLLKLDHMAAGGVLLSVPGPASLFNADPTHPDNIIFDITPNPAGGTGNSTSGFGHPTCLNTSGSNTLPPVIP